MENVKVLLIEDNPGDARLIREMLAEHRGATFDVEWRDDLAKGMKRLADGPVDLVLLDLTLPDSHGFNTFSSVQTTIPRLPIVVLTGLDDETIAVRAVRGGAQDYLVKGKVTGEQLARAIRYAIARKTGEKRPFTLEELKEFDGKDGRPAYVAYSGKVYDISASALWGDGVHSGLHSAGVDLTSDMGNAPHGEEVLLGFRIVGELAKQETLGQMAARKAEKLHLHPILVHFSVAYAIAFPLFNFLYFFTRTTSFEIAAFYMLIAGFATSIFGGLSGVFSWKVTYAGKRNTLFDMKLIYTGLLLAAITASLAWRILEPDILLTAGFQSYAYLALGTAQLPVVTLLGYYGGKIVFS
ncbi:MAG: response regulator [Chloroflexi bacterium]|nr:response regulator [Chloroflexota bacterium]